MQNEQTPQPARRMVDDDDTLCYRNDVLEEVKQITPNKFNYYKLHLVIINYILVI